jgi:hypothetical protein
MKTIYSEEVSLAEIIEAMTEEAVPLFGDEAAYQAVACAVADLLGNGSELSKKLGITH